MNIEGHVRCTNSSFANGNAYQGGAIYTWMWGVIEAENCSFTNNSAVGATHNTGGALFSDRGSVLVNSHHTSQNELWSFFTNEIVPVCSALRCVGRAGREVRQVVASRDHANRFVFG